MKTCGHVRNKLVSLNHCPLITLVALLRRDTYWQSAKWVWYFWWCVLKSVFFCLKYIKIIYIYFCYHHIASIWYGATPQSLGFNFGLAGTPYHNLLFAIVKRELVSGWKLLRSSFARIYTLSTDLMALSWEFVSVVRAVHENVLAVHV